MASIGSSCLQNYFRRHHTFFLQISVLITKSYTCFFRINLDTKLQFGNVYHCGQQTAIHLNQLSQKSHCCHRYCSHRCCYLCSHGVWAHDATAAECVELVGTFHSWIPNHGQWEADAPANRNASSNMLRSLSFPNGGSMCRHQAGGGLCSISSFYANWTPLPAHKWHLHSHCTLCAGQMFL